MMIPLVKAVIVTIQLKIKPKKKLENYIWTPKLNLFSNSQLIKQFLIN